MAFSRPSPSSFPWWIPALLALLFLFRLTYGFFSSMHLDEVQVFLVGLKYYCTGLWPYYGPDVTRHIQIPGALQGLAIGVPLRLWPVPESPYILVNLLSFTGLAFFAWYCGKRLPAFPRWILWAWLFTAPWTLNFSTNMNNVSYVLFGSCLFFPAFLETIPSLSLRILPPWLCNALMGFSFLWIAQFHLSFVILAPYIGVSLYFQWRSGFLKPLSAVGFLLMGAALPAVFLLPTYLKYGLGLGAGGVERALHLNIGNLGHFFTILARFLSFASCEVPRFAGAHTTERLELLRAYPWSAPFTLLAFGLGILQPVVMLIQGFKKEHPRKEWPGVRLLVLLTFFLVYGSFLFSVKAPAAHTYYLVLPLAMLYAFYVFLPSVGRTWFKALVGLLFLSNLAFHVALALSHRGPNSLYTHRDDIVRALEAKDHRLLGERRPDAFY